MHRKREKKNKKTTIRIAKEKVNVEKERSWNWNTLICDDDFIRPSSSYSVESQKEEGVGEATEALTGRFFACRQQREGRKVKT